MGSAGFCPSTVWSLGPKALIYESLEPLGKFGLQTSWQDCRMQGRGGCEFRIRTQSLGSKVVGLQGLCLYIYIY